MPVWLPGRFVTLQQPRRLEDFACCFEGNCASPEATAGQQVLTGPTVMAVRGVCCTCSMCAELCCFQG
jgi:hypothetical protein